MARRPQPKDAPVSKGLNAKREMFVREYLVDLNGKAAAIRAGYSPKTADKIAYGLLTRPGVQALVDKLKQARADKLELKSDDVLRELWRIANLDLGEAFDEMGNVKALKDMSPDIRRAISSVEDTEHGRRVRFWDKLKGLELVGKHLKMFGTQIDVGEGAEVTFIIGKKPA